MLLLLVVGCQLLAEPVQSYWLWSPDLGKWVNPKKSAKDTPEDQLAWAMQLYEQKDWDRAIEEFEKLPAAFPTSRLAAEGVYHAGLSWEEKKDFAKAADNYQKLINQYPYSDRIKDAVHREFEIAMMFASGEKMKVLGMPVLSGQEKAIELFKHIVKNAPFGSYGDQAQFQLGEVYKQQGAYEEAQKAFQAVVDEYPTSPLVQQARFEIANASMLASRQAQYNEQYAERAIEEFKSIKESFPDDESVRKADESIRLLREKKAETAFETGSFYERQKKIGSARVYYSDLIRQYPETQAAGKAKERLERLPEGGGAAPAPAEGGAASGGKRRKPWFKVW